MSAEPPTAVSTIPGAAARASPVCAVVDAMPPELPALAESVTFGTEGLRYHRLDVADQVRRLHAPAFVTVRARGRLLGAYALDRRRLLVDGREIDGIYRGLLCVAPAAQGRGVGRLLAVRGRDWVERRARERGAPCLSWGCIDADNHRSHALLGSEGARDAGGLGLFAHYRQWPRERVPLERLAPGRDPREAALLAATEADCALRDMTPSELPGLALVDGAGVRASARVAPTVYRIETMGRLRDALTRLLVMPFPFARRRFDPERFRFLRLGDIALRAGCEDDWPRFVSALLARHDAHIALAFIDPRRELHARLRGIGAFGRLLHDGKAPLRVMARWAGAESSEPPAPSGGACALAPVDG